MHRPAPSRAWFGDSTAYALQNGPHVVSYRGLQGDKNRETVDAVIETRGGSLPHLAVLTRECKYVVADLKRKTQMLAVGRQHIDLCDRKTAETCAEAARQREQRPEYGLRCFYDDFAATNAFGLAIARPWPPFASEDDGASRTYGSVRGSKVKPGRTS